MYGTILKELGDIDVFMRIHPSAMLLTDETINISDAVNIGAQACTNITGWGSEGRDYTKPSKKRRRKTKTKRR